MQNRPSLGLVDHRTVEHRLDAFLNLALLSQTTQPSQTLSIQQILGIIQIPALGLHAPTFSPMSIGIKQMLQGMRPPFPETQGMLC